MPEIDFLPFATAVDANVLDQADYAAASWVTEGFADGIAVSEYLNKVWRQSAFISAALANYVSQQTGLDVLDDGNLAGFITKLTNAIVIGGNIRPARIVTVSAALAVLLTDYRIGLNRVAGVTAVAATLPAGAAVGQSFIIEDLQGNFFNFPVTVNPQAGQTIAQLPNFVMNVNRQSAVFTFYGSNTWSVKS